MTFQVDTPSGQGDCLEAMKTPPIVFAFVVLGAALAMGQENPVKPTGNPIQGTATDQTQPQAMVSPVITRSVVVQERKYYSSGLLADITRRETLKKAPYANPNSPVQNPAIDLVTGRPRGVVLFSLRY